LAVSSGKPHLKQKHSSIISDSPDSARLPCNLVDRRRRLHIPVDAKPLELATDTGGPIADTY